MRARRTNRPTRGFWRGNCSGARLDRTLDSLTPRGRTPMLVMDAITEILKREGISTMFCFPTTPIIEAAVAGGMRPVICRQERVGVHMADGAARVTNGKPAGVFAMQYGPGAENAFAGIASAYSDSTPILLLPL